MDDKYRIPLPPPQEGTEKRPHPQQFRLDLFAVIVALIAAGFAGWQSYEAYEARADAKGELKAQRKDAESARAAAERSANSAQKLADGMTKNASAAEASAHIASDALSLNKRALRLTERPSLETLSPKFLKPFPSDPMFSIQTVIVNNGKGSAYDIDIWGGMQIARTFTFSTKNTKMTHTDILGIGGSHGAAITVSQVMKHPLDPSVISAISNKELVLYVYGWVKYKSKVFDRPDNQEPYTYCYYYAVPFGVPRTEPFAICPEVPALSDLPSPTPK